MRSLVTGCAGFIGSHLCEALLAAGHEVIGIDSFSDYYSPEIKERNVLSFSGSAHFKLIRRNILDMDTKDISDVLLGCDFAFHLAAQPGVRASWGQSFSGYARNNVEATQRLLEACKNSGIRKFIYSSSSSVYGNQHPPMREDMMPMPFSPYGVTKLAGENLCHLYWMNHNVPAVVLRYFTVYGPRQRPDMAIHKFVESVLNSREIEVFGNGMQKRDFTFVSDVVNANMLAASSGMHEPINIGGGSVISVNGLIGMIEELSGKDAIIKRINSQPGDVKETLADISKAWTIGYRPKVQLRAGLKNQLEWHLSQKS